MFGGDAKYAAATATRAVGVGVKVTMTTSGWFSTENRHGVTYRVYHHTHPLNAAVTVAPGKSGQCVSFAVQRYNAPKKAWQKYSTSACHALDKSSRVSASLTLLKAAGDVYRVRVQHGGQVDRAAAGGR